MLITRSDAQEPSGSKRSRLTLKGRREKRKEKERARENMRKKEAERDRQAQEEAEFDLAKELEDEAESNARRVEAEACEGRQVTNPDPDPLLMSGDERLVTDLQ